MAAICGRTTAFALSRRARRRQLAWQREPRAVPYTRQQRMRRQCCIAGRSRPAQRVASARCGGLGELDSEEHRLAEHPARLFVCARCRAQVLLCSRCDRGQRYCGRVCSRAARQDSRRETARRYQRSRAGRLAHAARSRRWRHRQCAQAGRDGAASTNFVTHQGSPLTTAGAPLPPCEQAAEPKPVDTVVNVAPICRRCAAALSLWTRQGFLRHARASRWAVRGVEPIP